MSQSPPHPQHQKSVLRTRKEDIRALEEEEGEEPREELDDTFFSGLHEEDTASGVHAKVTLPDREERQAQEEDQREGTSGRHAMASQRVIASPAAEQDEEQVEEEEEEEQDHNNDGDEAPSGPTNVASPTTTQTAGSTTFPHYRAPPRAQVPPHATLSSFHSERYAHFIRSYVGASDEEVEKAKSLAHRISMIGISKVVQRREVLVRTVRNFAKHSVLSVEGDAVFATLIRWAEKVDQCAAANVARLAQEQRECYSNGGKESVDESPARNSGNNNNNSSHRRAKKELALHAELLQPNARCIALHYGLPPDSDGTPSAYPQATLIVVVASTRLEENTEVYVSLDSYQRCLDEAAWYRHRYGHVLEAHQPAAGQDVLTGIKHFPHWPAHLPYYHGVGRQHASSVAQASFPFTLFNLEETPEFGKGELGVTAALPVPYGTCLLYTGPSVATKNIAGAKEAVSASTATVHTSEKRSHHKKKSSPQPSPSPSEEKEQLEEELDDTYALGLGQLGVCFGQGLARYINHRYNVSRYGTVELCSVMLAVQSEFAQEPDPPPQQQRKPAAPRKKRRGGMKTAPLTFTSAGSRVSQEGVTAAVIASLHNGKTTSTAPPWPHEVLPPAQPKKSHKRKKVRAVFLEEQSHFITVPFFIVTSDVAPGQQLLAWSYGDDYDAKLERQVIADGYLVPYVDAALLNERYHTHFPDGVATRLPRPLWQRYNGDYRYALREGDVVWRRRPLPVTPQRCGPAEDDLFILVKTLRESMEYVLLYPLVRAAVLEEQLQRVLREQDLLDYHSPAAAVRRVERDASSKRMKVDKRTRETEEMMAAWAVFPYRYSKEDKNKLPRNLQCCVVAAADTLVPLLADTDYYMVQATLTTERKRNPAGTAASKPHVLVNLDDLHHVTSLVLDRCNRMDAAVGAGRAPLHVPPLLNGLMWPLFFNASTAARRSGCGYNALYSTATATPDKKKTDATILT